MRPWINVTVGPAVALAKVGASADSAEEMKDTTGVSPWRLHFVRSAARGRLWLIESPYVSFTPYHRTPRA